MNSLEYRQIIADSGKFTSRMVDVDCDMCHGTGIEIIGYYGNGEFDECECVS